MCELSEKEHGEEERKSRAAEMEEPSWGKGTVYREREKRYREQREREREEEEEEGRWHDLLASFLGVLSR